MPVAQMRSTGLESRRVKRKNISGMALILTDAKSDGEIIGNRLIHKVVSCVGPAE